MGRDFQFWRMPSWRRDSNFLVPMNVWVSGSLALSVDGWTAENVRMSRSFVAFCNGIIRR